MGILKKITNFFSSPTKNDPASYWITVKCNRCGETIRSRINLYNDLSAEYGESGASTYICRKMLMGEGHCFQRVEVELTFDANRKLINREITGGQFVDQ
jgi:DNA-directed RNA polymerase subunit N (RpoN/RPB10)